MTTTTGSSAIRTVFRIGYGALQLEPDVDHVDTAEFYGFGQRPPRSPSPPLCRRVPLWGATVGKRRELWRPAPGGTPAPLCVVAAWLLHLPRYRERLTPPRRTGVTLRRCACVCPKPIRPAGVQVDEARPVGANRRSYSSRCGRSGKRPRDELRTRSLDGLSSRNTAPLPEPATHADTPGND